MFHFTIRELVLLTLVVAMGVGWWLEHQALRSELRIANDRWCRLSRTIWESGFEVHPDEQWRFVPRSDVPYSIRVLTEKVRLRENLRKTAGQIETASPDEN